MLKTNLQHIRSGEELTKAIQEHENLMVCCGRMGPMCVPVYHEMEMLRDEYPHVVFTDMDFDHPDAAMIRNLPECRGFMGLPFTVYYKNGKVAGATGSIQTRNQIKDRLDRYFS